MRGSGEWLANGRTGKEECRRRRTVSIAYCARKFDGLKSLLKNSSTVSSGLNDDVVDLLYDILVFEESERESALYLIKDIHAFFSSVFSMNGTNANERKQKGDDVPLAHILLSLFSVQELSGIIDEWDKNIVECFDKGIRFGVGYGFASDDNPFFTEGKTASEKTLVDLFAPSMSNPVPPTPFSDDAASLHIMPKMLGKVLKWMDNHPEKNRGDIRRMRINMARILEEVEHNGRLFGMKEPTLCECDASRTSRRQALSASSVARCACSCASVSVVDMRLTAAAAACGLFLKDDAVPDALKPKVWREWLSTLSAMMDAPSVANPNLASYLFSGLLKMSAPVLFTHMEPLVRAIRTNERYRPDAPANTRNGCLMALGKASALTSGAGHIISSVVDTCNTAWTKRAFLLSGGRPENGRFWFPEENSDSDVVESALRAEEIPGKMTELKTESAMEALACSYFLESAYDVRKLDFAEHATLLSEFLSGRYDVSTSKGAENAFVEGTVDYLDIRAASPLASPYFFEELNSRAERDTFWRNFKFAFTADCLRTFSVRDMDVDFTLPRNGAAAFFGQNPDMFVSMVDELVSEGPVMKIRIPAVEEIALRTSGKTGRTLLSTVFEHQTGAFGRLDFHDAVGAALLLGDPDNVRRICAADGLERTAELAENCLSSILDWVDVPELREKLARNDVFEEVVASGRAAKAARILEAVVEKSPELFADVSVEKLAMLHDLAVSDSPVKETEMF